VTRLIQILGRGARKPDASKTDCIVIDHGGSISRLNTFFEDEIEWVLESEKDKELTHEGKPVISCPSCGRQYRGGACQCGYSPTPKEAKAQGAEWVAGELVEIQRKDKKEPGTKKTCEQIMVEALYRAGRSNRTWKQAIGIAKAIAKKQGTTFRVPSRFQVGGTLVSAIPFGDPDGVRKVSALFDGRFS
jgi:superfamily II DNA or RNA helicase